MNFPLIITGLVVVLIGTFIAGLGWNWEKIKGKYKETRPNTAMKASTSGDQSPAINIGQQNIIFPPKSASKSPMSNEKSQKKPIENFASRYTLAADMNILTDYVHVNGINVRGNVNVDNAEGVELKKMKIFNADEYSKGKINIDRSQEFSVKENIVGNEINVARSKSFDVTRNTVGENVDRDKQAQESINIILTDSSTSSEIMSNLAIIQKLITNDNILANALGHRIETLDKENKGYYKNIVLNHFKNLDAETIQKAETKGVGMGIPLA
jgi:hypothetical protein